MSKTFEIEVDVSDEVPTEDGETEVETVAQMVGTAFSMNDIVVEGIFVSEKGGDDE